MANRSILLDKLTLHAPHIRGNRVIPAFLYGTAWKKEATSDLVYKALSNGFTAIDTANQPKHYRQDLVGQALRNAISKKLVTRADIYVQTKFTSMSGQDPTNVPYDPNQRLSEQVKQSVSVSLQDLDTSMVDGSGADQSYIDALVLHSPMSNIDETMEVWHTLESYVPKQIIHLGISNCDLFTLMELYERANIKPAVVQNRFHSSTRYDIGLRQFCQAKSIVYQSFWTLTANKALLDTRLVEETASLVDIRKESALYCLVLSLGNIVILNGTTSISHMKGDWNAISLAKDFAVSQPLLWGKLTANFKQLIGQ